MTDNPRLTQLSSGVSGLDTLLNGGFIDGRLYLVIGPPGTGKTTLGVEFLQAGLDAGETVLFIHGEESKADLCANAAALGIDISDASFLDIGPESEFFNGSRSYDVVRPQDVADDTLISDVRTAIEELDPDRVLIDPVTQFQYVEPNEYQFRKRIISFARFLKGRGTTVLATKTPSGQMDTQLRSLSDGVVSLAYEEEAGRRISVPKHRGVGQRDGTHGLEIREGGAEVYPALSTDQSTRPFEPTQLPSGVDNLDTLLGGGLERGTITIISGPSGTGKTTMATEFLHSAATSGDGAVGYLFEESFETFRYRAETFGIDITGLQADGTLTVDEVDPLTLSAEEFARQVQTRVRRQSPELVVIDGVSGYRTAIKGSASTVDLRRRLHALTQHLTNTDTSVIVIDQQSEVTGLPQATSTNVSYVADNIVFQNYIELDGELERVVGVLKKRVGDFETTPRQFRVTADGLEVGAPLTGMHGILDGVPDRTDRAW
ncbi:AAA family ATPase [Halovenus sp. WSH3]|uniref:non-specific serine/threonine protein kinase n=1 Tax=Halovenus carboxidivorans TaxID=2692199 RepID=A0A6B0T3N6_9EURY|nr:ATPase domain-containing protein [Halovenus carboxidivorans]MXR51707.1 AAA family ATPase [Halovenus carboxidivorans]